MENNEDTKKVEDEKLEHPDYNLIPLRALNISCRRQLSIALLPERPLPALTSGITRDWQGLCELADFDYDMIKLFKSHQDPVVIMLEFWAKQQTSIAQLINALEVMERFDIIEDIQPLLKKDALAYLRKEEREGRTLEPLKPREDIKIISGGNSTTLPVTVSDVVESPDKNDSTVTDKYDAYVSYGDSDADFVSKLIQELEGNFKLRLFVKDRDLLPGVIETEADLHLINERCDKILLIVSQESLNNPYCEFQTVLAQAAAVDSSLYARKLIPIICKPCALPQRFKYLAKLDYNKKDLFGSFWKRLYCSIKSEINDAYVSNSTMGYTSLSPEITTVSSTGPLLNLNTVGPYGAHNSPQPSPSPPIIKLSNEFEQIKLSEEVELKSTKTDYGKGSKSARSSPIGSLVDIAEHSAVNSNSSSSTLKVKSVKQSSSRSPLSGKKKFFTATGFFGRRTSS